MPPRSSEAFLPTAAQPPDQTDGPSTNGHVIPDEAASDRSEAFLPEAA